MKTKNLNRLLTLLLCAALFLTLLTACAKPAADAGPSVCKDGDVLGSGKTAFTLLIVDKDGTETAVEIHTDETTVGAALLAHDLISGETSEYGLYVKTVNGITADYDTDKTYWGFYIDGEYAMTGVDATEIVAGTTYTFRVEQG